MAAAPTADAAPFVNHGVGNTLEVDVSSSSLYRLTSMADDSQGS
jgi:hypothetical protein